LTRWITAGFAGELGYMEAFFERQERLTKEFPDLKSIIVVAVPYDSFRGVHPSPQPGTGRIARYAWGRDYHRAMGKRLKRLESFIRSQGLDPPPRLVRCVDTSPIQERALAEVSGLGFFGKNSCLIRPNGGSFFFLGALLTNLELVPDEPIRWDCGACTLCLEACPTQALIRPYELDARRCISYLTIELKTAIDPHLRPRIQDWIFGCDICQEVCPYNRKADQTPWEEFKPAAGAGTCQPLKEILECRSDEEFLERFSGTPLMRAKRDGLLRNASICAGNAKDPRMIPALGKTLAEDSSALVRQHAAWALGKLATPETLRILQEAAQKELNCAVQAEIVAALKSTL